MDVYSVNTAALEWATTAEIGFILTVFITLSCKYLTTPLCTQNAAFLYGLGMVYFHYNAFQW